MERTTSSLSSGAVTTVDFTTYVKNVLPNEWISTWLPEALKAGAMAAKMYGWYRVYYPKYPGYGYDVKDSTADQVYAPGSARASTDAAVDAVDGIGLENSQGNVFEAQYLAGTPGVPGTASSGKVMQWGTQYFASAGTRNYLEMCHYYYDYSDKSAGATRVFNYGSSPATDGNVYQWNGAGWSRITGSASKVSVDNAGNPWVVNNEGILWRWNGVWTKMRMGDTQDVGCGPNGQVGITMTDEDENGGRILKWDGSGWTELDGRAVAVDVGHDGSLWVINAGGIVWQNISGSWYERKSSGGIDIGCNPLQSAVWLLSL